MLVFHAKTGLEGLQSGADRPPLGRPAWGCGDLATAFAWTLLIVFWGWYSLRGFNTRGCILAGLGEAGKPPSGPSQPSVAPTFPLHTCDLS